jgi:hypothetical protein
VAISPTSRLCGSLCKRIEKGASDAPLSGINR